MQSLLIVIPAHNEEEIIKNNVQKVLRFLHESSLGFKWYVLVAENGSQDATVEELKKIDHKRFSFDSYPVRSRSKAILKAWLENDYDYYMFMDADLPTDIKHIPALVHHLQSHDIVIGSRRLPASQVHRTWFRRFLSWGFHSLMKLIFQLEVNDLQCGFKAINKKVRDHILPQMKYADEGFLDTELLVVAHAKGYSIKEIPVSWADYRASKFKVYRSVYMNIYNAYRIKRDLLLGRYK